MEVIAVVVEEKEVDFNNIMPACIMEKICENDEHLARLEERRRVEKIESNIKKSNIIRKINNIIREYGECHITLGDFYDNSENKYWLEWNDTDRDKSIVKNVTNRELFDYLINAYTKAGYRIGGYGWYSANYYKTVQRTIYAETNCNTCEI